MKIRVVSLVHAHISFWHAAERALGYGALYSKESSGSSNFFSIPTDAAPRIG